MDGYDPEFVTNYPGLVCRQCDSRALNSAGNPARHISEVLAASSDKPADYDSGLAAMLTDDGDNPVFIDSFKCWRRYRFGGWVTMIDPYDSENLEAFYEHQHSDRGGSGQG